MSQRPWGPPAPGAFRGGAPGRNPFGQNPYGQNPYGRSPFGQPYGRSPYPQAPFGLRPTGPAPRRRSPIAALLRTLVILGMLLLAAVVVTNLAGTTTDTSYQNTDYQVPPPDASPPPLPEPETYREAQQLVGANPLYDQTAPNPVECEADPIDVSSASNRQLETHFTGLMECLVRIWEPPVTAAGFQIVRPSVTVYGRSITTRCGESEVNAFYCGADQQVYYSSLLDDALPIVATDRWGADVVMAHEFGHALQARTAILVSSSALGAQSGEKSTELDYSRRLETQADCLSGISMRSVSEALNIGAGDRDGILRVYNAVGDDSVSGNPRIVGNHGLARSREFWGARGLDNSAVGSCNTYTASASQVR